MWYNVAMEAVFDGYEELTGGREGLDRERTDNEGWLYRSLKRIRMRASEARYLIDYQMKLFRESRLNKTVELRYSDEFNALLEKAYEEIQKTEPDSEENVEAVRKFQLLYSGKNSPVRDEIVVKGSKYGDSGMYKIVQYRKLTGETNQNSIEKRKATLLAYKLGEKIRPEYRQRANVLKSYSQFEEYSLCNQWDWFVTLTLDKSKIGGAEARKDNAIMRKISKLIFNENLQLKHAEHYGKARAEGKSRKEAKAFYQKKGIERPIKYLISREKHKDGSWHFHGLMNIPEKEVERIEPGMKQINYWGLPVETREYAKKRPSWIWVDYYKNFGLNILTAVPRDDLDAKMAVTSYCKKYIAKSFQKDNKSYDGHHYIHSRGLNGKEEHFQLSVSGSITVDDVKEYGLTIVPNYCYCIGGKMKKSEFFKFVARYGIAEES
jgi:hypothetical protein